MIRRYSSRHAPIDDFLTRELAATTTYDHIAGYFSSSVLEIAGEAIEQVAEEVHIVCNSHLDPVEDRVHQLLSERLADIKDLFGQVPDTLDDVWMEVALAEEERAKRLIDAVPKPILSKSATIMSRR